MAKQETGLPLAFALAISLIGSTAEASNDANTVNYFKPGRLSDHLDQRTTPDRSRSAAILRRTAQWLNWFNCYSGSWRRC